MKQFTQWIHRIILYLVYIKDIDKKKKRLFILFWIKNICFKIGEKDSIHHPSSRHNCKKQNISMT